VHAQRAEYGIRLLCALLSGGFWVKALVAVWAVSGSSVAERCGWCN
jgi:hypothetical protein